jgi:hypothetical protein
MTVSVPLADIVSPEVETKPSQSKLIVSAAGSTKAMSKARDSVIWNGRPRNWSIPNRALLLFT